MVKFGEDAENQPLPKARRSERALLALQKTLSFTAVALLINTIPASSVDGTIESETTGLPPVVTATPSPVIVSSPEASSGVDPNASPTPTSSRPSYKKVNADCHEGTAVSMTWQALDVDGAKIQYVGLKPDGALASPDNPKELAAYDGSGKPGVSTDNGYWPQVGARKGNVLTGAHRYYEKGKSVFAPNLAEQLATVAVGSVITFKMKDGGTCSYIVKEAYPKLDKFNKKTGFPYMVEKENWYRKDGPPGLFVDGCTGPWNAREGTSQDAGVAIARLMNDLDKDKRK